jgi:uncharacterized membrane protein HdeD (DUF308 family)
MSMPTPAEPEMVPLEIPWYWYACIGILFVFLGAVGLTMPFTLTDYSVLILGFFLIFGGVSQIITGIFTRLGSGSLLLIACGLLYVLAGGFAVSDPDLASEILTLLLSIFLIITGVSRMLLAFQHRRVLTWLVLLLSGFITICIGVYILRRWPWSAEWVIGLFFAIDLIAQGASYLMYGFHLRAAGLRGT